MQHHQQQVSTQLLKATQIGTAVGKLRKHPSKAVCEAAKKVVAQWKSFLFPPTNPSIVALKKSSSQTPMTSSSSQPSTQNSNATPTSSTPKTQNSQKVNRSVSTPTGKTPGKTLTLSSSSSSRANLSKPQQIARPTPLQRAASSPANMVPNVINATQGVLSSLALGRTNDKVRNKIQELLFNALGHCSDEAKADLAVRIEQSLFLQFGGANVNYKNQYRLIVFELNDSTNPDLNERLLSGEISPHQLATMQPEDMASSALSKTRQENAKWMLDAVRSDWDKANQVTTDNWRCGKCGQRKCVYYQKQTRSADEPMTTFVTCTVCNNRFRC